MNDGDDGEDWKGSRSYVHCLSNKVVLSGDQFERHFSDIIGLRYPSSLIPRFIHEVTHHATFQMPFWTAASLGLSESEKGILNLNASQLELARHADGFLFGCLLQRSLSPLLEGMACFAEFDLLPGLSQTVSAPSTLLSTLLILEKLNSISGGILVLANDRGVVLREALTSARRTKEFVERRSDFLASGYNPLANTHLFGYVFFKAFWVTARRRTPAFEDPELFLAYVLEYVFADAEATSIVLDFQQNAEERIQRVLDRVRVLLYDIACIDQSAAALLLDQRGGAERPHSQLELDLERQIKACLDSARNSWGGNDIEAGLSRRQARQLAFRDYISIGVSISINPVHISIVRVTPTGRGPVCKGQQFPEFHLGSNTSAAHPPFRAAA